MSAAVSTRFKPTRGSAVDSAETQASKSFIAPSSPSRSEAVKDSASRTSPRTGRLFGRSSGLFKKRSDLSEDARRDSGMAPSLSTSVDQAEPIELMPDTTLPDAMPTSTADPNVPAIIINGAESKASETKSQDSENASQTFHDAPSSPIPRTGSYTPITTGIPTGDLEDPFSSKLQFSNRGSLLLSGNDIDAFAQTLPKTNSVRSTASGGVQAAYLRLSQRRVSADDRRISRRVRSFYEPNNGTLTEETEVTEVSALNNTNDEERDKVSELNTNAAASSQTSYKRVSIRMEPNEAAGGTEDWTDVDSRDVDRYGFIKPRPASSKASSFSTAFPGSSDPPQSSRVGTSLTTVEESQPTSPNSGAKPKASRLSLTPDGKPQRTSPSMRSSRSRASSVGSKIVPFRGKRTSQPRWLNDAPDILLPPPGFGEDAVDPANINPARESRRMNKWQKMATQVPNNMSKKGAGMKYTFQITDPKLISRVWKGIPDRWRSEAWHSFLSTSAARRSSTGTPQATDEELERFFHECQDLDCADDMQIDMDVPRTIGNHLLFRKRYHGGQRFLFRVLRALSLYFPDTGYVQGMASVVATLLVYYEESRAFVMSVRLWQLRGIGLLYTEGFQGLLDALKELEEGWMKNTEVIKELESLNIYASAWGTKWYLTLFNYVLPFHTMLRVWDVFILLGDAHPAFGQRTEKGNEPKPNYDVLHAVASAMLSALRETIVGADFENAMKALTSPVMVGKDDKLMNISKKIYEQKRGKR